MDEEVLEVAHTIKKIRLLFEAVYTSFKLSRADEVLGGSQKRLPGLREKWSEIQEVMTTIDRHSSVVSLS